MRLKICTIVNFNLYHAIQLYKKSRKKYFSRNSIMKKKKNSLPTRINSYQLRARVLFLSHLRSLFLSLFISAGGMTERVLSSRYAARATPRRSFCRWQLRDTKWAAHSVSHACRGFDARIARSAASRRSRPPQAACVVRVSPGEVTRL